MADGQHNIGKEGDDKMRFVIGHTDAPVSIETSESLDKLMPALIGAIKAAKNPKKDAQNPHLKNRFASLGAVLEEMRASGFVPIQLPVVCDTSAGVFTTLWFENQYISWPFLLPLQKNDAQGVGSAVSYARRYSLQTILQLVGEDDDGEAAVGRTPHPVVAKVPPEKLAEIKNTVEEELKASVIVNKLKACAALKDVQAVCKETLADYKALPKALQETIEEERKRRIQTIEGEFT